MENFNLSGKANHVFRILQLRHIYQTEVAQNIDKTGCMTIQMLFINIPTQIQPHEYIGHPCCVNKSITCSRDLNDSCQGCPEYKEKDGE